jgi:hypothetical protein
MSGALHIPAWIKDGLAIAKVQDRVLLLFAVLLLVARIFMAIWTGYTADDAFITYRYASNLVQGSGFVYNPGEACLGTSTPLFAALLAAGGLMLGTGILPMLALCISVVADLVTLIALWKVLDRYKSEARFVAAALWALYPKSVLIGTLGMETSLVVACMAISLWLLVHRRADGLLICIAVLLLLRVDTILWCTLLAGAGLRERLYPRPAVLIAVLACMSACVLLAMNMWGSPIPWSVQAKAVAWSHLFPQFDPMRVVAGLLPFHDASIPWLRWIMVAVVLMILVRAMVVLFRRRDVLAIVPGFGLLYLSAFSLGRTVMFDWYLLPCFFSIFIAAGFCWEEGLQSIVTRTRQLRITLALHTVLVGLLMVLVIVGASRWKHSLGDPFRNEQVRIGDWLAVHAHRGESIMLEPIGYIGWKSNLYVHDLIGLVSPEVTASRLRWPQPGDWFIHYVMEHTPTYIILQEWELRENRLFPEVEGKIFPTEAERDWFVQHYAPCVVDREGGSSNEGLFVVYRHRASTEGRQP